METQNTTQIAGERQHRAQTNIALLVGFVSRAGQMKFAVNTSTGQVYATNERTGKPLEICEAVIRVEDQNGDATFFDVEAKGDDALGLFGMKRGSLVQLAGRYEVHTTKRGEGDDATYFVNDKFKIVNRSTKMDGTPNPDAIAPIMLIEAGAKVKQGLTVLAIGTLSARGVAPIQLNGNRVKAAFSFANNTSKADRPSWFDVGAFGDVARDAMQLVPKSLVKISGSVRKFDLNGKRRIEINAKTIEVISLPKNAPMAPAAAAPESGDDLADHLLDQMYASENGGARPAGAIDLDDNSPTPNALEDVDHEPATSRIAA